MDLKTEGCSKRLWIIGIFLGPEKKLITRAGPPQFLFGQPKKKCLLWTGPTVRTMPVYGNMLRVPAASYHVLPGSGGSLSMKTPYSYLRTSQQLVECQPTMHAATSRRITALWPPKGGARHSGVGEPRLCQAPLCCKHASRCCKPPPQTIHEEPPSVVKAPEMGVCLYIIWRGVCVSFGGVFVTLGEGGYFGACLRIVRGAVCVSGGTEGVFVDCLRGSLRQYSLFFLRGRL